MNVYTEAHLRTCAASEQNISLTSTSRSIWTMLYGIPDFSSQKDYFCHQIFLISGMGGGVSGEEARSQPFLLLLTQRTPVGCSWQEISLYPHCTESHSLGSGMGVKEERMTGRQFQAPTGTSWSTPLSPISFVVKARLCLVII